MLFAKFDLAMFPYCLKSSYGRLLSRKPTNPYNTIKKQVWHYCSGKSCLAKVKNSSVSCAFRYIQCNNSDAFQMLHETVAIADKYSLLHEVSYMHDLILQTWLMGAFNLKIGRVFDCFISCGNSCHNLLPR